MELGEKLFLYFVLYYICYNVTPEKNKFMRWLFVVLMVVYALADLMVELFPYYVRWMS